MSIRSTPHHARANISRVPYLPGLDGLRAIAVIAVIIYHANSSWLHGGFLGVEVFFVISGYLITLLLISEDERSGFVNLKQFWIRRFRRLLPALYVMLAGLAIYLAVGMRRAQGQVRGDIVGAVSYVSNWYQVWVGQGYTANQKFVPLRHLWSLAVEEQFYLIWPLVMVVLLRRGRSRLPQVGMWLFGISAAIALAVALLYYSGPVQATCANSMGGYWKIFGRCVSINDSLYLGTFTRAGGLMMGAGFAMVWRPLAIMRGPLRNQHARLDLYGFGAIAALVAMMWAIHLSEIGPEGGNVFDPWLFRGGFFLTGVLTLIMISAVTHQRSTLGKLLGTPVLNWVGTRSYGLYLYHWPIYQIIRKESGIPLTLPKFVIAISIAAVITEISYRYIESPIRSGRLSQYLRGERQPRTVAARRRRQQGLAIGTSLASLAGFAGVSIAVAENRCVSEVECSIANNVALDRQVLGNTTSTTSTSTTTSTTLPGQTSTTIDPNLTTTTQSTTTTVAPDLRPPVAFGESVMLGAVNQLNQGGVYVEAGESRQGKDIANAVSAYMAQGLIGTTVIIQSGTNGPVSDETYDSIISQFPTTTRVYMMTVRAPDRQYIIDNNARIRNLPLRYPNVVLIDWEGASQGVTLCKDSIHIACGTGAAKAYTNLILGAIGYTLLP